MATSARTPLAPVSRPQSTSGKATRRRACHPAPTTPDPCGRASAAPSSGSRCGTPLPPRPATVTGVLCAEVWREDIAWPVREGGAGNGAPQGNFSLDVDIGLARRALQAVRRPMSDAEAEAASRQRMEATDALSGEATHSLQWSRRVSCDAGEASCQRADACAEARRDFGRCPQRSAAATPQLPRSPRRPLHGDAARLAAFRRQARARSRGGAAEDRSDTGEHCAERAATVRWCFRRTREEIEERLEWLDQASFSDRHRGEIYCANDAPPPQGTATAKILKLYHSVGVRGLPREGLPTHLDGWAPREGGLARTNELVLALETWNFFRWISGVPRLKLDALRQELVEVVLQTMVRRDMRARIKKSTVAKIRRYAEGLGEFLSSEGRVLLVSQLPSAVDAVRCVLAGLPGGAAESQVPTAVVPPGGPAPPIPGCAEVPLAFYMPFLRLARRPLVGAREDGSSAVSFADAVVHEAPPLLVARAATPSEQPGPIMRRIPAPMDRGLSSICFGGGARPSKADTQFEGKPQRRCWAWGDTLGALAFRRCALDPRVKFTGILRRGCRVCLWVSPQDLGEPADSVQTKTRGESFLDLETMESAAARRRKNNSAEAVLRWQEDVRRRLSERAAAAEGAPQAQAEDQAKTADTIFDTTAAAAVAEVRRQMEMRNKGIEEGLRQAEPAPEDPCDRAPMPLMVCFPPPGIVPMELMDRDFMPWTISPDPHRLMPTSSCGVRVMRVSIDPVAGTAHRLSQALVPLGSFCVDYGDSGTPFCAIFTLTEEVRAGDQFEVVLSGLADRSRPDVTAADLRYFVSFEDFQRGRRCDARLRERAAELGQALGARHLWTQAQGFFPATEPPESRHTQNRQRESVSPRRFTQRNTTDLTTSTMTLRSQATPEMQRQMTLGGESAKPRLRRPHTMCSVVSESEAAPLREAAVTRSRRPAARSRPRPGDPKSPPAIGVANAPGSFGSVVQGDFGIDASENEVLVGLVAPSSVILKATLNAFARHQGKWEVVPQAVSLHYFEEPYGAYFPAVSADDDFCETFGFKTTHTPRKVRIVMRVLIPFHGRFQVELFWGQLPSDLQEFASLQSSPVMYQHPLTIKLVASRSRRAVRQLVPGLTHSSVQRFGYPQRHLLADHFGVVLVSPVRFRLRTGWTHFAVYVRQRSGPTDESQISEHRSMLGGSSAVSIRELAALHEDDGESRPVSAAVSECDATEFGSEEDGHAASEELSICEAWDDIEAHLARNARRGTTGSVCIAAVFGKWRRIEVLHRRLLEPEEDGLDGLAAGITEVHEARLRVSEADEGQAVQLMVYQSGAMPSSPTRSQAELEVEPPAMGAARPPIRWCLAEFFVEGMEARGYDEEEMAKPLPPEREEGPEMMRRRRGSMDL